MDFKYVRIQGREVSADTNYAAGIFSMCWKLIQEDVMDEEDVELFKEIDSWFAEELPFPDPCMRKEPVVCFFKTANTDLMMRMIRPAMWLLERYNHPFYVVYTNSPGEIVYEDDYQVAVKVPDVPVTKFNHEWTEPGTGLFEG
ncbi:MAG: hypothetical protein E7Z99_09585 [Coriobacteriaceae bacterium]|nr:hypothetical protein [Coriobacteriaceae bacterium]